MGRLPREESRCPSRIRKTVSDSVVARRFCRPQQVWRRWPQRRPVRTRPAPQWLYLGYREARRATFRQSVARLQQASGAAVSTLLKIMVDATAPHSIRVRAADSVLDHAAKAIEIEDIEVRVAALEQSVGAEKPFRRCSRSWWTPPPR